MSFTRCDKCGQDCESRRELAAHIEARHFARGRRFFLMGALALPIASKIELAAAPAVTLVDSIPGTHVGPGGVVTVGSIMVFQLASGATKCEWQATTEPVPGFVGLGISQLLGRGGPRF